jgi:hypothetical protein
MVNKNSLVKTIGKGISGAVITGFLTYGTDSNEFIILKTDNNNNTISQELETGFLESITFGLFGKKTLTGNFRVKLSNGDTCKFDIYGSNSRDPFDKINTLFEPATYSIKRNDNKYALKNWEKNTPGTNFKCADALLGYLHPGGILKIQDYHIKNF